MKKWTAIVRYQDAPQTAAYEVAARTARSAWDKASREWVDGLVVAIIPGLVEVHWSPED